MKEIIFILTISLLTAIASQAQEKDQIKAKGKAAYSSVWDPFKSKEQKGKYFYFGFKTFKNKCNIFLILSSNEKSTI